MGWLTERDLEEAYRDLCKGRTSCSNLIAEGKAFIAQGQDERDPKRLNRIFEVIYLLRRSAHDAWLEGEMMLDWNDYYPRTLAGAQSIMSLITITITYAANFRRKLMATKRPGTIFTVSLRNWQGSGVCYSAAICSVGT